jgi:hypothetical protein
VEIRQNFIMVSEMIANPKPAKTLDMIGSGIA